MGEEVINKIKRFRKIYVFSVFVLSYKKLGG